MGRGGDRQALIDDGLVHEGDVAVLVGNGAAQQRHVQREGLVVQILFAVEVHQLGHVGLGDLVHAAALHAGVNEGAEAHLAQQAGASGADLAPEGDGDALGQAPALQLVVGRLVAQREGAADVGAVPLGNQARAGFAQTAQAAGADFGHVQRGLALGEIPAVIGVAHAPVAHGAALMQLQAAGMAGGLELVADGADDLLREAGQAHAGDADAVAVLDQLGRLSGGNKLCHVRSSCV